MLSGPLAHLLVVLVVVNSIFMIIRQMAHINSHRSVQVLGVRIQQHCEKRNISKHG